MMLAVVNMAYEEEVSNSKKVSSWSIDGRFLCLIDDVIVRILSVAWPVLLDYKNHSKIRPLLFKHYRETKSSNPEPTMKDYSKY
ncbi:hypothetical protein LSH36_267g03086 [Paralvinella palmiformis]|uniref:Uncharacterized protein n=1 Tax=Paralvinella palmiformis TaxID=53620 RepID=A0AAD9N4A1_9ANNE|nr:hypothetical protein LSH36_267g03086 [Paralvinella palmiformis]